MTPARRAQSWRSIRAIRRARRDAALSFWGGAVLILAGAVLAVRCHAWPELAGAGALLILWAVACRVDERREGLR